MTKTLPPARLGRASTIRAHRLSGYALLLAGMSVVGVYVALSRPLTGVFPVFLLAGLRFALAALMLLPWTFARRGERRFAPGDRVALGLQSFFGNFLFSLCMLAGMARTSATVAGVVLAALPAVVALMAWVFLREAAGWRLLLSIALAVAGVAGAAAGTGTLAGGAEASLAGIALLVGCQFCEGVYVILGKRLSALRSPLRLSALLNLTGLAFMAGPALWQARDFDFAAVPASAWWGLVLYAFGASVLSTWLWLSGLQRVPAAHSGVFTTGLPIAATATGVLWLGEAFGGQQALGLALALAGMVLIAWPTRVDTAPRARAISTAVD